MKSVLFKKQETLKCIMMKNNIICIYIKRNVVMTLNYVKMSLNNH